MLTRIIAAIALAGLLIAPALSQPSTPGSAANSAKPQGAKPHGAKPHASKSHAGRPHPGKSRAAKKAPKRPLKAVKITPERRHALLTEAAAINEELVAFALDGKAAKVAERVTAMRRALPYLNGLLSADALEELTGYVAQMEQSSAGNDVEDAALDALEAYRVIEQAIEADRRSAPLDVAMLDYGGLKLAVLALSEPAWPKIAAAAKDVGTVWSRLEEKVGDADLRNAVGTIQRELLIAVIRKDIPGVKLAAKKLLDAVSDLETYFKDASKVPESAGR